MVAVARSCEASPVRALRNTWALRLPVRVLTLARISLVSEVARFSLPSAICFCVANPIAEPAEKAEISASMTVGSEADGDLLTAWSA